MYKPTSLFVTIILLLLVGCNKENLVSLIHKDILSTENIEDPIVRQFLTKNFVSKNNSNLTPTTLESREDQELLDNIINELYLLDKKENFIKHVEKKYGYPIWDRSDIFQNDQGINIILTPISKLDGDEITAYFFIIEKENGYHFRLVKRDKIDKNLSKNKDNIQNLGFHVLSLLDLNLKIFGNSIIDYITWLETNPDGIKEEQIETRDCYYVRVIKCTIATALKPENELETRGFLCRSATELVCNSGTSSGGISGGSSSCQECSGTSDSGSSGGGGGSSNTSTTTSQINSISNYISLTTLQRDWLAVNAAATEAVYNILTGTTYAGDKSKGDAIFKYFKDNYGTTFPIEDILAEAIYIKTMHPTWNNVQIAFLVGYNLGTKQAHTLLDLVGLVPGVGEVADFTNGVLYTLEGDGLNATISFAATVPFVGWGASGTRLVFKIVKTAKGGKTTLALKLVNGVIEFGSSGQLANVLHTVSGYQAHHIIPWALRENTIIQKAAKTGVFHMNDVNNGINLSTSVYSGYSTAHRIYSDRITNYLNSLLSSNLNDSQALSAVNNLMSHIKSQLASGKLLDEVIIP